MKEGTTYHHIYANIEGLLKNYANKSMADLFTYNDIAVSDKEARKYLEECKKKGWKVFPLSENCKSFDYFGAGCPGHKKPTTK